MIAEYKRTGMAFGIPGLLLFGGSILTSYLVPKALPSWISAPLLAIWLVGVVLLIIGLCFYAKAKGYLAVWGFLLPITGIGLLVLTLLRDRTEDRPRVWPPESPLLKLLARASVFAPVCFFITSALLPPLAYGNQTDMIILGSLSTLLVTVGFIFGIAALAGTRQYDPEGVLGKAITGIFINGVFVVGMLPHLPEAMTGNWPVRAPAIKMYDHAGVRFSYDSRWDVVEWPESTNKKGMVAVQSVGIQRTNKTGGIYISLFPFQAGRANPSLEDFGKWLTFESLGITNASMERITGNLGGVVQPGLRFHITTQRKDGSMFSAEGDFFMLQNSRGQVIVNTLVPDNVVGRLTVRSILRSLNIEGMSGVNANTNGTPAGLYLKMIVYNSKNTSAMIGNITVKVGDVINGFKIVAIEKDLVIVQSPAGVKKSLRMGDDLK
jgi:hypothetical protein